MNWLPLPGGGMEVVKAFENSSNVSAEIQASKKHIKKCYLFILTHLHNLPILCLFLEDLSFCLYFLWHKSYILSLQFWYLLNYLSKGSVLASYSTWSFKHPLTGYIREGNKYQQKN